MICLQFGKYIYIYIYLNSVHAMNVQIINPRNKLISPKIKMSTHMPFDIQVLIIQRLPLKSLIRFRSVCKAWKSFIGCSEFIAGYSFRHTQSQYLMISYKVDKEEETEEVEYVSFDDDEEETEDVKYVSFVDNEEEKEEVKYVSFVDDEEETEEVKYVSFVDDDTFPQQKFNLTAPPLVQGTAIIGSSHGLLCLSDHFGEPDHTSETQMAVIWNPAIRKSIAVDVPNMVHQPFNSIISFGVCPDTKDPKLVKITYIDDDTKIESISCIPLQVMAFTLSSREWTELRSNLPRKSIQFTGFHTVIGQFIYWVAYDWSSFDGNFQNLIMSFDLSTDEFKEVHLPDSLHDSNLAVSRLRESLVLLDYVRNFTTKKQVCDVWMMDHGDSKAFTKLYTINPPNASVEWIVGFRETGEPIIEMQDDVMDPTSALAVYEPCLKDIKDLGICGIFFSFSGSSYTESLLLLDHDNHCHIVRCGDVKRQNNEGEDHKCPSKSYT